jgi:ABC-type transport system involved in cytochrome c biogenesis permease component
VRIDRRRFAGVFVALFVVVVVVAAGLGPPDSSVGLRTVAPGVVVALVLALLVAAGGE